MNWKEARDMSGYEYAAPGLPRSWFHGDAKSDWHGMVLGSHQQGMMFVELHTKKSVGFRKLVPIVSTEGWTFYATRKEWLSDWPVDIMEKINRALAGKVKPPEVKAPDWFTPGGRLSRETIWGGRISEYGDREEVHFYHAREGLSGSVLVLNLEETPETYIDIANVLASLALKKKQRAIYDAQS